MTKNDKTKMRLLEAAHEMAKDLYSIGAINAKQKKKFDVYCLPYTKKFVNKKQTEFQKKILKIQSKIKKHFESINVLTNEIIKLHDKKVGAK